ALISREVSNHLSKTFEDVFRGNHPSLTHILLQISDERSKRPRIPLLQVARRLHFTREHTELMVEIVHVTSERREIRRNLKSVKASPARLARTIPFSSSFRKLFRNASQVLRDLILPQAFRQQFSRRVHDAIETRRIKPDHLQLWKRNRRSGSRGLCGFGGNWR